MVAVWESDLKVILSISLLIPPGGGGEVPAPISTFENFLDI